MDNTGGAAEWSGPDIARASARGTALSDKDGLAACPWSETNQSAGTTGGQNVQSQPCSQSPPARVSIERDRAVDAARL